MSIGQKIIELRKARGLSRTELANIMGIPYPTWSKYEKDERQIDHALLIVLADFFDVTTDLLLGRQTEAVKEEGLFYNLSEEEKRAVRGHADSKITFSIYGHVLPKNRRRLADRFDELVLQDTQE